MDIAKILIQKLKPESIIYNHIEFIEDRLFNDKRYCINTKTMKEKLDWKEEIDFENGINITINWYKKYWINN
jgi:dTDP-glucose 4,6-dehydratase